MNKPPTRFSLIAMAINNLDDWIDQHWQDRWPNIDLISQVVGSSVAMSEIARHGRVRRPRPAPVAAAAPIEPVATDSRNASRDEIRTAEIGVEQARVVLDGANRAFKQARHRA